MNKPISCDIFCTVVDNYGDIGVSWRLARQLAHEHGMMVRLWVDDLSSFRRLCPDVDAALDVQRCHSVEVRRWHGLDSPFALTIRQAHGRVRQAYRRVDGGASGAEQNGLRYLSPNGDEKTIQPAELVIEAFGCVLPESYIAAMAAQARKPVLSSVEGPVWINLEHLSAEEWVAGCHGLPSPHPSLPLVKYFFFPGFTPDTGGLLLESDLMARRDGFQRDPLAIAAFWHALGVPPSKPDEVRVSLFCYENPALSALFSAWSESSTPILCLVPEGRALPQVAEFFGLAQAVPGESFRRGSLEVRVLPFMEQDRYDELLWACDLNFVRGEDSCVRAQWAARPFVWHIYPQHDKVHIKKLRAFMDIYCSGCSPDTAHAMRVLWEGWNNGEGTEQAISTKPLVLSSVEGSGQAASTGSGQAWNDFWVHQSMLRQHAQAWAQHLSGNSLALNLLNFFQKIDRMHGS